jgi:natural product biosynthesis luciferase-like monooxygenase protein
MRFSVLYFSSRESGQGREKYQLLLDGARFADDHAFDAVWIPERHFHPFGGLYPNPSVLAAVLASTTRRLRLRAGSVVLPLHSPLRVAEEWAVVDNLSDGRVDIAFATGWNANDFVLAPDAYADRVCRLFEGVEQFQRLWSGEELQLANGAGCETAVRVYPRPVQPRPGIWLTCTGTPQRYEQAGALGSNVLTALLFQTLDQLKPKIRAYREARAAHGFDPATGHVTLMLHTYLGRDLAEVRRLVRPAFVEYLATSVDLWQHSSQVLADLSDRERESVLAHAFERYFRTASLMGTPESCVRLVEQIAEAGVDELACLIDFGLPTNEVLAGLESLDALRRRGERLGS